MYKGVENISRRSFMAELKSLLGFMDEEDRARALARYDELFRAVGPENEDALAASFGSAVKQVLILEKEYSEARKIGIVPFLHPMKLPAEFIPEKFGDAPSAPGGGSSFVRSLADVLEKDALPANEESRETIGSMDEEFPLEELLPPGESPLKTWETVFPEVEIGLPAEPEPAFEEAVIPTDDPYTPAESDGPAEEQQEELSPEERGEEPAAGPGGPAATGAVRTESGEAEPEMTGELSEPEAAEEPGETEKLPYALSTEEITTAFAEEPADLSVPVSEQAEPAEPVIDAMAEDAPLPAAPRKQPAIKAPSSERSSAKKKSSPGAGRVRSSCCGSCPWQFSFLWVSR